jgi:hypothetical protein
VTFVYEVDAKRDAQETSIANPITHLCFAFPVGGVENVVSNVLVQMEKFAMKKASVSSAEQIRIAKRESFAI